MPVAPELAASSAESAKSAKRPDRRRAAAYDEAVRYVYGLSSRGVDLGLDRIHAALAVRGSPHQALRVVHVGGTNGKGSVSSVVERVLRAAGYRTGLYTSPHLHRFTERIRVNGRPISDAELVRRVRSLREEPGLPPLTFFETATLLAFEAFAEARCDVVVLEVGLGGRFDATNVVVPELAVLTNVGLDHTGWLGTTHAAIAGEKVAIAKRGRLLVHGVEVPEARAIVEAYAASEQVPLVDVQRDVSRTLTLRRGVRRLEVHARSQSIADVPVRLAGAHQVDNLTLAVTALLALRERGFVIDDAAIRRGAARVRWPGRLERIERRGDEPAWLLDGAHNADGCRELAAHLGTLPPGPRILVFGAMADKDLDPMLAAFEGVVDSVVFVAPELARAERPEALARRSRLVSFVAEDVRAGLRLAEEQAGSEGLVVVAGSLFVVAAARAARLGLRVDPPIAM